MAKRGNPNSVTDAGVGALCARTAVLGATMNVRSLFLYPPRPRQSSGVLTPSRPKLTVTENKLSMRLT